jgi:hypothetical protein
MYRRSFVLAAALLMSANAMAVLVDNFDSYAPGQVDAVTAAWKGTANMTIEIDPNNPDNNVIRVQEAGATQQSTYCVLSSNAIIPEGATKTLFLRFRATNQIDSSFGLTDAATPDVGGTNWGQFNPQVSLNYGNFRVRDAGAFKVTGPYTALEWYNMWMVVDNATDTMKVYLHNRPSEAATEADLVKVGDQDTFVFRNKTTNDLIRFYWRSQNPGGDRWVWIDDIYMTDGVSLVNPTAPPAPTGPKVIFVTSVKDNNLDGVQDDISWKDWLEAEGYDVDFRPGYWSDPLDANEIAELEAADLILASRGMATGDYDGAETPKWNSLTKPILCTNAWMIRNNRWKWMNSGTANKDADSPLMLVSELDHPIFAGLPIDEDGLLDVLDPNAGSGNTSFLTDFLDPGNGTLLSMSLGIYTTAWIVEWQPGVEYYAGAGEIAGGRRMLFMAGTQDDPYTDPNGNIMPVGVFNLNEAGQQLLRNILAYMLRPEEVAVENFSFETPQVKCQNWDGGTNSKGTFEDVPGWSSDTMAEDSGIEGPDAWPGHTDGVMAGYMMGTDPSAWNTTSYIIGEGDKFTLSVDARDNWTDTPALPAKLAMTLYCDVGGTRIPLATTSVELTTDWTTFTLEMTADALAAGLPIGIELKNASAATTDHNSWIGMDNVRLTVK